MTTALKWLEWIGDSDPAFEAEIFLAIWLSLNIKQCSYVSSIFDRT